MNQNDTVKALSKSNWGTKNDDPTEIQVMNDIEGLRLETREQLGEDAKEVELLQLRNHGGWWREG